MYEDIHRKDLLNVRIYIFKYTKNNQSIYFTKFFYSSYQKYDRIHIEKHLLVAIFKNLSIHLYM